MTRIIELTKDVQEKINPDALDLKISPKTIPAGCIGVVVDTIVSGHSMYVNFGWGIGVVAISEHSVKDLASDTDALIEYLRTRHKE